MIKVEEKKVEIFAISTGLIDEYVVKLETEDKRNTKNRRDR